MAHTRREMLAQRVETMRSTLDQIVSMDQGSVLLSCPLALRDHLSLSRLNDRFAIKSARGIVGGDLFAPALDDREQVLREGGAQSISILCAAVGTHILWQDVLRIVHRADHEQLDAAVGLATRTVALRGRARDIGVLSGSVENDPSELASKILNEGALSWACWLAGHDVASARRLRVLTPISVASRVARSLPDDADIRERRRFVVDVELNAMMGFDRGDVVAQEVG